MNLIILTSLLLSTSTSSAFFFPPSGCSSCNCPSACPQVPTCAIPLPCSPPSLAIPAPPAIQFPTPNYQPGWIPAIPSAPAVTSSLIPTFASLPSYNVPMPTYTTQPQYKSTGMDVQAPIFTSIPAESYLLKSKKPEAVLPTLMPSLSESEGYVDNSEKYQALTDYDDTAPALPPPIPPAPTNTYRTTDTVQYMDSLNDNPPSFSDSPNELDIDVDSNSFLHSGEASIEWPTLPMSRKSIPDGLAPFDALEKRHSVLKRMRNSKTAVPHTNSTCNSHNLASVMAKAIVEDVSVSKRMVMRATELAFDGARFDVFCATGEFSYSIHSRKYCEVTSGNVTCFAFR